MSIFNTSQPEPAAPPITKDDLYDAWAESICAGTMGMAGGGAAVGGHKRTKAELIAALKLHFP
jgi:hypothetical protein